MEYLFQMGSYYVVLVGPEPTHVCKSVWPQVCDNLNLLAECWDDSPVQFGKVGECPEFIIQGSFQVNLASWNSVFVLEVPATQSVLVPSSVILDSRVYQQQSLGSCGYCQRSFPTSVFRAGASGVWMTCERVVPCDPVFLTAHRRMRAEVWQSSVAGLRYLPVIPVLGA